MVPPQPEKSSPPQLPNELCRDVVENLHHFRDRNTLLCLTLVSKAWCAESQRLLFSVFGDDATDLDDCKSLIRTHTLFLKTIILNPTRLGPYVHTYKQHKLLCHPRSKVPFAAAASYLRDLTTDALPALINLKHLFIVPLHDDSRTPQAPSLEGCTFKLETLRWGFEVLNPGSVDPFVEFLRTQHDLSHLEVGFLPPTQNFAWLPDDVCPNLSSTSCQIDSMAHFIPKRKNMVGLEIWSAGMAFRGHLSGLGRLKYLSMPAADNFISHLGATDSRVVLLELTYACYLGAIQSLSFLPNLRVLALLQAPREQYLSRTRSFDIASVDVKEEYNIRMQLTTESFRRCPNLEYVIIEDIRRGDGPRRFRQMSILELGSGKTDTVPDIQSKEFLIEHEPGARWWTAYGLL